MSSKDGFTVSQVKSLCSMSIKTCVNPPVHGGILLYYTSCFLYIYMTDEVSYQFYLNYVMCFCTEQGLLILFSIPYIESNRS